MFSTNVTPVEEDQEGDRNVAVAETRLRSQTIKSGVKGCVMCHEADSAGRNRFCFTAGGAWRRDEE